MHTAHTPAFRFVTIFAALAAASIVAAQSAPPVPKVQPALPPQTPTRPAADTCLMISAENIAKGSGNFHTYIQISDKAHKIEKGDRLQYDILMPTLNPLLKGGVDADLANKDLPPGANRPWIRDCGIVDQGGITAHGDGILEPARDKWYHRVLDLSKLAGATTTRWNIVFEGDKPGRYMQFLDNIRITRDGKTVLAIYENEKAPEVKQRQSEGFSKELILEAVPRSDSMNDARITELLEKARKSNEIRAARSEFHSELEVARELAGQLKNDKLIAEIDAAAKDENVAAFDAGDFDAYFESVHKARHRLGHAHPQMQKFTGHLVGHAHIDLQWLWSWDETIKEIIPQTFGQAIKFMREYPDFTFSQSSATLYDETEKHYPELFKDIQQFVKEGRWELVGGRWCEGDNNMISPESHVRQLLYGQRYFQKKFGRICNVGWEPDTFGHCWTMPQILKKAGIDYYYFCRAGKKVPLFWWESPDGSKVLAFEEPATGGWYNDVVTDEQVRELAKFATVTGSKDHLMIYGVGNHGGGPTREYIEAAIAMRKRGLWPSIKFSTAGEFFRLLTAQIDNLKIPTIKDELNPIFEGCYTSHSRIKKYNRDSESLLESAEVFAALATVPPSSSAGNSSTLLAPADSSTATGSIAPVGAAEPSPGRKPGVADAPRSLAPEGRKDDAPDGAASSINPPSETRFTYPRDDFESMWRDVCWNHHHDTLPGSFINEAAQFSYKMYDALEKRGHGILERSLSELARRADAPTTTEEIQIIVFNPLAWTRTEAVETSLFLPQGEPLHISIFDGDAAALSEPAIAEKDAHGARKVTFLAKDIPGCGYKVFSARVAGASDKRTTDAVSAGTGIVATDARLAGSFIEPRFQILHEKSHGMTAWTVGEYDKTSDMTDESDGTGAIGWEGAISRGNVRLYRFGRNTVHMEKSIYPHTSRVDYDTSVDWHEVGNIKDGSNMLKVAFDTGLKSESAVYEIPFGDVTRKNDGHENVALKWVAITGTDKDGKTKTVAILNDCKHAYDVKDGIVRITLLRSSYDPDPKPDVGRHEMRYAVLRMDGPLDRAAVARAAWEFNKPLQVRTIYGADGLLRDDPVSRSAKPAEAANRKISMDVPPTVDAKLNDNAPLQTPNSKLQTGNSWSGCSVEPANIILTSLKLAEDNDDIIIRAYECAGTAATAKFSLGFPATSAAENDLLEREMKDARPVTLSPGTLTANFKPYEIRTFRLRR